jgi:hypothetical protein
LLYRRAGGKIGGRTTHLPEIDGNFHRETHLLYRRAAAPSSATPPPYRRASAHLLSHILPLQILVSIAINTTGFFPSAHRKKTFLEGVDKKGFSKTF